jgi:hypothetical protein
MADKHKDFFKVAVFEREEHQATLRMLTEILERLRMRGANGMFTERWCRICERLAPNGRAQCLHVTAKAHVESELARLTRPLRLREPIPDSYRDAG